MVRLLVAFFWMVMSIMVVVKELHSVILKTMADSQHIMLTTIADDSMVAWDVWWITLKVMGAYSSKIIQQTNSRGV
jgi:hypothetical protein